MARTRVMQTIGCGVQCGNIDVGNNCRRPNFYIAASSHLVQFKSRKTAVANVRLSMISMVFSFPLPPCCNMLYDSVK